jgi:putative DNA primase/helicase
LFLLKDRRLVWTSEINDGRYFDASVVKSLTGGDKIVGRRAYSADAESFVPTHTIMMLTNSKPRIKDANDYALFRRLHLIPFRLSFVLDLKEDHERPADPDLETKLTSEASGILAWLVRGTLMYQEEGCQLNPPQVVLEATSKYQQDEDILGHFMADCIQESKGNMVKTSEVYRAYREWSDANGHFQMSSQKFHQKIQDHLVKKKSSVDHYVDIRVVDDDTATDDPTSSDGHNDF